MNDISEYLEKMKNIQQNVLEYVDDEDDSEDKFQKIKDIITKSKIEEKKDEFTTFLCLLSKISNNHHRNATFFNKINRILEYLKDDLQKFYSNSELFHIFKSSKRILLSLIEANILSIDESIARRITQGKYLKAKYPQYFQTEIQPFVNKKLLPKCEIEKEIPDDFNERRKTGENDDYICELIQKDSQEDFIVYMNQNNYEFKLSIKASIYETNNFLLKKENCTLIEYAAFFGSIQIFNYLRNKGVELAPSLWLYAIHGNNAEIIQILEDNQIKPQNKKSYEKIMKESIKCHHNEIADYIQNNYLVNENEEESKCVVVDGIKYRNFKFIQFKIKMPSVLFYRFLTTFHYLCEYDYYTLVSILLNTTNIDINYKTIYKTIRF